MNVIFTADVYKKLRAYVLAIDTEIGLFGKVEKKGDVLFVSGLVLLSQQVSWGKTIIDRHALDQFYLSLMDKGIDPSPWKCWIHSHATMKTFFSTTDEATIESFDLEHPVDNWFLSIVVNHAGSLNARLDVFSPFRYTIGNLPWDVEFEDPKLIEEVQKEIAEKVVEIASPYGDGWEKWREQLERMKRRRLPTQIILAKD